MMFRCSYAAKSLAESSSLRLLSSAAPSLSSSVEVTKSSLASFSRLEALREKLANEDANIDDFAEGKSIVVRRKAAPRSAKILPKPKWLKVQPANSDNYKRLRKTVRESGLATVW